MLTDSTPPLEASPARALGDFIRAHRERLSPQAVGLPPGPRRRTPGLRREEVAQLCGVSPTWYTWIEQGRPVSASADAETGRPCSIHVYQVGLTPHSCATSSRRRPGVRRRGPGGRPTACGDSRSRWARMKSPSARAGVASSGGG